MKCCIDTVDYDAENRSSENSKADGIIKTNAIRKLVTEILQWTLETVKQVLSERATLIDEQPSLTKSQFELSFYRVALTSVIMDLLPMSEAFVSRAKLFWKIQNRLKLEKKPSLLLKNI